MTMQSSGTAPPHPIVARLAGARAVDRSGAALMTINSRGLRPRTPSSPGSLALARSTGQELRS